MKKKNTRIRAEYMPNYVFVILGVMQEQYVTHGNIYI